jgi:hypothetical protein
MMEEEIESGEGYRYAENILILFILLKFQGICKIKENIGIFKNLTKIFKIFLKKPLKETVKRSNFQKT